jgi:PncC family amidohydrolase
MLQSYLMNPDRTETIEKVHILFKEKELTLSLAESCTGGMISHMITTLPGASEFYKSGIVSYSVEAKTGILGVSRDVINNKGMVSEDTAREMAERVRLITGSDYSISSTGNLGPGVLEDREVGLVYIAASSRRHTVARELRLKGNREENKEKASISALRLLVELVKEG